MDVPIVPGPGSGRSPVHQLIAKLFEAEQHVAVEIPGANGELESSVAQLTEGLITLQGMPVLSMESYCMAPELVREAHMNALRYLSDPGDTYEEAWSRGVHALYPTERVSFTLSDEQLASLRAAHPVYEPIVDAIRTIRSQTRRAA